jgi:hypothetical protein
MYLYNLANGGNAWIAIIFCVTLVIFGSFFLLNLVLAVIMQAFITNREREKYAKYEEDEAKSMHDDDRALSYVDP